MSYPSIYKNASNEIQNIIIQLGSAMFQYLNLNTMDDEEVIMKYNTINKNDIRETYEGTIDGLRKDKENLNNYHKNEEKHIRKEYEDKIDGLRKDKENLNNYHKDEQKQIRKEYEDKIREKEKVLNDNNNTLHTQINTLRNEIMTCENEYREKFRTAFEDKYKERENQLEELNKEKVNQLGKLHESEIDKYKEKINQLHANHRCEIDKLENEIKINNERVNPLLDSFTEKKTFNNSTEQGDYGEGFLDDIVNKGLPFDTGAFIDDSSKVGGSGDRIIRFKNGTVMMIEVKNENVIKKGDREQFQEHSKKDFEEKKCTCALFLSLRTEQIPKIGKAIIPIYNDNMVYYGLNNDLSLLEKKNRILSCIEEVYMRFIQTESISDGINPQNNEVIYNKYLENLNNQKNDYEDIIKRNERTVDSYKKKLTEINKNINQIYREIQNKNIKIDEKLIDEKLYITDFKQRIKIWKEEKSIIFKKEYRKKIMDEMDLSELDKTMLKKIKLSDIQ